ncbi:DNA-binding HxlR family transcriptional regulator [Diaminobutyricimonas aerilata]|uniref:DNA-binding HxlR family transcriptional regulator n=1 Tax=Diaminobutyricimonas aerilata TaxID=1162967 RepID=A0A2M9CFQ4_9MICO|nr:helix-turn-helix domain-containing protein [Diaminobutyricimonas aerilata]PJJ70698.1 DNA-binding HxlR family transcriptional regulator [Diaminobutyricimonas aerilata]
MNVGIRDETADCQRATDVLARTADKWTVRVFIRLQDAPRRFGELRRMIDGISPKMLASTLRGLERDGLVSRTVFPTNPPSVEYALTDLGRELAVPVQALGDWVLGNLHRIEFARAEFDDVDRSPRR